MFTAFDGLELPIFIFLIIALVAAVVTFYADRITDAVMGEYAEEWKRSVNQDLKQNH